MSNYCSNCGAPDGKHAIWCKHNADSNGYTDRLVTDNANSRQVGGNHYTKLAIQPMQYSMANKLDACQHTIVKYVTRFRDKGGIQDLEKAKHVIDLLIEFERSATK